MSFQPADTGRMMKLIAKHPYAAAVSPFAGIALLNVLLGNWFWATVDAAAAIGAVFYIRWLIRRYKVEDR